jgi:hypothetical protein
VELNLEKVRASAREASTEDLLDRVTAYRAGMEPEALTILEEELGRRGVGPAEIAAHAEALAGTLVPGPDGIPLSCSCCRRPAVSVRWAWHRVWGVVPLFPRRVPFCAEHDPAGPVRRG